MPAWGNAEGEDEDSWKLVFFIRHLPELTANEKSEMQAFNPTSTPEMEEKQEIDDFLAGEDATETHHEHHH